MSADGSGEQWWSVGSGAWLLWNLELRDCWVGIWWRSLIVEGRGSLCARDILRSSSRSRSRSASVQSQHQSQAQPRTQTHPQPKHQTQAQSRLSIRTTVRNPTGRDESDHRSVTAWGGMNVSITNYIKKGGQVYKWTCFGRGPGLQTLIMCPTKHEQIETCTGDFCISCLNNDVFDKQFW